MKTTLDKIREHFPCALGWKKLLAHLGKIQADDEPLSIKTVLESNGLDDALWCLRAVDGHDREIRLYAVWCARQVQHLTHDKRIVDALNVVERFANGTATPEELDAAGAVAGDAAEAVAGDAAGEAAAWAVAREAAGAAARAAEGAARPAAWSAAGAAQAAARAAARAAAWSTAREAQEIELIRLCDELESAA